MTIVVSFAINPVTFKVYRKIAMAKKLTPAEKYQQLKKQTEDAGMLVVEQDGKIVVTRKKQK